LEFIDFRQYAVWLPVTHNGPAIWGGCVTRRSILAESWYFSQKTVTVQGGYGALFAIWVQVLLSITRVGISLIRAANLSSITNLMRCPDAVAVY